MSNPRVAADTGEGLARCVHGFDVVHDVLMTLTAGVFRDAQAPSFYLDRFVKFVGCKRQGVEKAVISLREIFRNKPGRRMAIITCGDRTMTGLNPAVEMVLHDVAIGAGPRIVAQIRGTLRVYEGVGANARSGPDTKRNHNCQQHSRFVRRRDQTD